MLKKPAISLLALMFLLLFTPAAYGKGINIDKSKLDSGIIGINYHAAKSVATKVLISKDNVEYYYNLKSSDKFPLQLGDGEYKVFVLENVAGNQYKVVGNEVVSLKLSNPNDVFLQSNQIINWHENMDAIRKAKELTVQTQSDQEKVAAIYNYIVNNVKYDYVKANNIDAGYLPSIDGIFKTSQGICYDYAALFAAMARSAGVPTKLLMGRKNDIAGYHAWNQVYLKSANKWVTIDITYDSVYVQKGLGIAMIKDASEYSIEQQY